MSSVLGALLGAGGPEKVEGLVMLNIVSQLDVRFLGWADAHLGHYLLFKHTLTHEGGLSSPHFHRWVKGLEKTRAGSVLDGGHRCTGLSGVQPQHILFPIHKVSKQAGDLQRLMVARSLRWLS